MGSEFAEVTGLLSAGTGASLGPSGSVPHLAPATMFHTRMQSQLHKGNEIGMISSDTRAGCKHSRGRGTDSIKIWLN